MFLVKPDELGRGGMGLSWKDFSKGRPIANIKLLDNNTIEFLWNGFYNIKNKGIEFNLMIVSFLSQFNSYNEQIYVY